MFTFLTHKISGQDCITPKVDSVLTHYLFLVGPPPLLDNARHIKAISNSLNGGHCRSNLNNSVTLHLQFTVYSLIFNLLFPHNILNIAKPWGVRKLDLTKIKNTKSDMMLVLCRSRSSLRTLQNCAKCIIGHSMHHFRFLHLPTAFSYILKR